MDYEWKVIELEKQLAHAREMLDLTRARRNSGGSIIDTIVRDLDATDAKLKETDQLLNLLSPKLDAFASKVDRFLASRSPEHENSRRASQSEDCAEYFATPVVRTTFHRAPVLRDASPPKRTESHAAWPSAAASPLGAGHRSVV